METQTNRQEQNQFQNSISDKLTTAEESSFEKPEMERELHVAVMCDAHVPYAAMDEAHNVEDPETGEFSYKNTYDGTQAAVYASALKKACDDGYKTVLVVGDLVGKSKQSEYDLYKMTIAPYEESIEVVESMGNHELCAGEPDERAKLRQRWRDNMGTGVYFDEEIDGAHVWALGSDADGEAHWGKAFISQEQLDWLEAGLDDDYNKGITSIVMCHWPADATYPAHNKSDEQTLAADGGCFADKEISARLRNIVISHPNAIMLSGHTHAPVSRKGKMAIAQPQENGGIFVHAGVIKSASPKWTEIDEVDDGSDEIKTYEIRYSRLDGQIPNWVYTWSWEKHENQ